MRPLNSVSRDHFFRLILLGLFALNVTLVYIENAQQKLSLNNTSNSKKRFNLIPKGKISSIIYLSIKNRFGEIEFLKESPSPHPWLISTHNNLLADTKQVNQLLDNLDNIVIQRQIKADDFSIKNYSIDKPFLVISYLITGNPLAQLKVGLVNDLKKVAYIQYGQSQSIFEVSYRSFTQFNDSFSAFTNKNPLNFLSTDIKKIEISSSGKVTFSIKLKNQKWVFEKNDLTLNQKKVRAWLKNLKKIRTTKILDKLNDLQKEKIDKAKNSWRRRKLTLHLKNNKLYEYDLFPVYNIGGKRKGKSSDLLFIDKFRPFPIILENKAKRLFKQSLKSLI